MTVKIAIDLFQQSLSTHLNFIFIINILSSLKRFSIIALPVKKDRYEKQYLILLYFQHVLE